MHRFRENYGLMGVSGKLITLTQREKRNHLPLQYHKLVIIVRHLY